MKQIRRGTFETNSSSVHSLSIEGEDKFDRRILHGAFVEFGWGYDILYTPENRLSYVLTTIAGMVQGKWDDAPEMLKSKFLASEYFIWLNDMVATETDHEILFDWDSLLKEEFYPFGYIDHQSIDWETGVPDVLLGFWKNEKEPFQESMKDFIFNNKYVIIIDNDNH